VACWLPDRSRSPELTNSPARPTQLTWEGQPWNRRNLGPARPHHHSLAGHGPPQLRSHRPSPGRTSPCGPARIAASSPRPSLAASASTWPPAAAWPPSRERPGSPSRPRLSCWPAASAGGPAGCSSSPRRYSASSSPCGRVRGSSGRPPSPWPSCCCSAYRSAPTAAGWARLSRRSGPASRLSWAISPSPRECSGPVASRGPAGSPADGPPPWPAGRCWAGPS
jgi:hypothetical protein